VLAAGSIVCELVGRLDDVDVARVEVEVEVDEDEEEVVDCSEGKPSPGLNATVEFLAYASWISNVWFASFT
jgi:hypothetical protein